ncbi:MAG: DUF2065 domain-containing protein [Pseudomonadota bacterium]|jgi:hypothetical protein
MNLGINWVDLGRAVALLAVAEGILPFLSPEAAKASLRKLAEMEPVQLRIMGFVLMVVGCLILLGLRA